MADDKVCIKKDQLYLLMILLTVFIMLVILFNLYMFEIKAVFTSIIMVIGIASLVMGFVKF